MQQHLAHSTLLGGHSLPPPPLHRLALGSTLRCCWHARGRERQAQVWRRRLLRSHAYGCRTGVASCRRGGIACWSDSLHRMSGTCKLTRLAAQLDLLINTAWQGRAFPGMGDRCLKPSVRCCTRYWRSSHHPCTHLPSTRPSRPTSGTARPCLPQSAECIQVRVHALQLCPQTCPAACGLCLQRMRSVRRS